MKIRLATAADIPFLMSLARPSATAAQWTEPQYELALQQRLILVAEEASTTTTADSGSGLLGFLVARHVAPEWELENIVVAARTRRNGLATQLLNALLARARETHSEAVFLEVRESNTAARTLYEKAGFEQTGRRAAYYTNPAEDAILYRRRLP